MWPLSNFILLDGQLKMFKIVMKLYHNKLLIIIRSSNNRSLIEWAYWNSCFVELMCVR